MYTIEAWFIIIFLLNCLHEAEEVLTYSWRREKQLSKKNHLLSKILQNITPKKIKIMIGLQLLFFIGIFFYYRWEKEFYPFLFGISFFYYLHFFIHIIQALLLRAIVPGLYTSIFGILLWAIFIKLHIHFIFWSTSQILTSLFISLLFYLLLRMYFFYSSKKQIPSAIKIINQSCKKS